MLANRVAKSTLALRCAKYLSTPCVARRGAWYNTFAKTGRACFKDSIGRFWSGPLVTNKGSLKRNPVAANACSVALASIGQLGRFQSPLRWRKNNGLRLQKRYGQKSSGLNFVTIRYLNRPTSGPLYLYHPRNSYKIHVKIELLT
jgi:hypothetical protein